MSEGKKITYLTISLIPFCTLLTRDNRPFIDTAQMLHSISRRVVVVVVAFVVAVVVIVEML